MFFLYISHLVQAIQNSTYAELQPQDFIRMFPVYFSSSLSHTSVRDSLVTDILGNLLRNSSSKGRKGSGDELSNDVSTHLGILIHSTELFSWQPLYNFSNKLLRQKLLNSTGDSLSTYITSHSELGAWGSTDSFSGAHPWFLRVEVSRPQYHGHLGPEVRKSCHAHIRVISSRTYISQDYLNLSGDRVLASEVGSQGGDHGVAIRAGVGGGDGKKGEERNNEFHDDFLTSFNK